MSKGLVFFFIALPLVSIFFAHINTTHAAELVQEKVSTVKAKVLTILKQEERNVPGTDVKTIYQNLKVEIVEGEQKGKNITLENDYLKLKVGETFYLMRTEYTMEDRDVYAVLEPYRLPSVLLFVGLFVLCVLLFGGIQGVRGLVSLIGSFALILYVLLPGILHGYSPIAISIGVSSLIIIVGSYITHGFNKTTTSAVIGMIVTVIFTGILAFIAVHVTRLSGFSSDESVYLNMSTNGSIDFAGLLLGGIMIGLLGVLYDVSIGQAISVEELHRIAQHLPRKKIYTRAIRIGREHIGALVNTLAIAYVGASLPLLLLFYSADASVAVTLNREIFSTEIIRTMIGSIGLVLAVPITTLISVFVLMKKQEHTDQSIVQKETEQLEHFEHHH